MRSFSRWMKVIGLITSSLALTLALAQSSPSTNPIRGFLPSRVAAERELERRFRTLPDSEHAESNLRRITSRPHMAGTDGSRRLAEWLRDQYASFGFSSEIVSFSVWLPQPRDVTLELITPGKKILATPEPPIPGDDDTRTEAGVAGFNAYSPSGDVTGSVVYVNYGMAEDYRQLESLGIGVEGKVALARYGRGFRGIKAKLAEEHKAAGLIIYSDPHDDGYVAGDPYPRGPWRPMGGIQRGSIQYTQIYSGDPLTPGIPAVPGAKRLSPAEAPNLPHIPTMPISAQDASAILQTLSGPHVPKGWQGGLPFTYHVGPGDARVHMKLVMDYQQRTIYDVVSTLGDRQSPEWVLMGNHHDAWIYGAADPGSGTATMLETARALGELARSGWKPRRAIVIGEWDSEEFGLIGSTEWVEQNVEELQKKAVAYVNTDVAVIGPNFGASATPSLKELIREVTREVQDPKTGRSVYDAWREHAAKLREQPTGMPGPDLGVEAPSETPVGALGGGSDYGAFLNHAGIPCMDLGSTGDYGVYHSLYDDFDWMKRFGDPNFVYIPAMARILGTIALRLDEADVLPFDYAAYATEAGRVIKIQEARALPPGVGPVVWKQVDDAEAQFSASANRASQTLESVSSAPLDPSKQLKINRALARVEQAFLSPDGLVGRPWFKHTIFAPGSYAGYAAKLLPGVSEALDREDAVALQREAEALAAALRRAAARLDEVARLAQR